MIGAIKLFPQAVPAALIASAEPARLASWAYESTLPAGILRFAYQASWENLAPAWRTFIALSAFKSPSR